MPTLVMVVTVLVVLELGVAQPSNKTTNTNTPLKYYCGSNDVMSPTSFFKNLNSTLSQLRSQLSNTGVYYARANSLENEDAVYGVAQCRNYLLSTECLACFDVAVSAIEPCGSANGAHAFWITASLDTSDFQGARSYSYEDLKLATNNFSEEHLIGKGGFGEVFKAIVDDGVVVAVKKLNVGFRAKMEFENEVNLISNVRHRNLNLQLGWCIDGPELLLVLEYIPQGSLDKFLWGDKKGTLNWKQRSDIIFGIARGLAHLHGEFHLKIIHRDIKPSNILLDNDFQPKIADFGLARLLPEDQTHVSTRFAGTMGYTAPEYATRGHLSEKVDTYSFGIVALEVISGRRCSDVNYSGPRMEYLLDQAWQLYEKGIHIKLIDGAIDPNEYQEENVLKIIEIALMCTQSTASLRPTMSEVYLMLSSEPKLEQRQMSRPTFVDVDRRIHIGGS